MGVHDAGLALPVRNEDAIPGPDGRVADPAAEASEPVLRLYQQHGMTRDDMSEIVLAYSRSVDTAVARSSARRSGFQH
jgi:hypothetical protein